ncbi:UNVERIFIED_CONTAM: Non-specific lipid-transfer protein 2 [Sesamum radiatum]|uniref:Non-specific lipid-transfer protein n=1 Tax=Sesamum radiatum TaxID=300843 RepID=A0AAW2S7A5_SESRA
MAGTMIKSMCMMIIVAIVVARGSEAAIGCGTVVSYMNACIPYVTDKGPLGGCCGGVKGLYAAAKTTPDRQSVCNCLKSLLPHTPPLTWERLPGFLHSVVSTFPTRSALPQTARR